MSAITKAVLPIAGVSNRLLPAARLNSRKMMTIADKPFIQYAVEEAVASGVRELIFVIGGSTRSVEDDLDKVQEPDAELASSGTRQLLEELKTVLPADVICTFVRHGKVPGLGHAILCAKHAVGDQPFAVILADDLIEAEHNVLARMVELYDCYRCCIVGVQAEDGAEPGRSDLVVCDVELGMVSRIASIFNHARSSLLSSARGIVGRFLLTPRIFHHLESLSPRPGGELRLTDAIRSLLSEERVLAYQVPVARQTPSHYRITLPGQSSKAAVDCGFSLLPAVYRLARLFIRSATRRRTGA